MYINLNIAKSFKTKNKSYKKYFFHKTLYFSAFNGFLWNQVVVALPNKSKLSMLTQKTR